MSRFATSRLGRFFGIVVLSVSVCGFVHADDQTLPPSAQQALQAGLELESHRKWGDSVRLYEQATKKWTQDPTLELRLSVCRVHADIQRRYQDKSFIEATRSSTTDQALELYNEVLSNLETYYVENPIWEKLQRHGTAFLEVALTEPLFLQQHLPNVNPQTIEDFRLHVHEYVANRPTVTRYDLRANASFVAGLARQHLGLAGQATVLEYVCGAVGLLDPYTRYLTRQQLDETLSNIDGNFVGLGVELKCETEGLRIVSVIPGGPADQSGIRQGDSIIAVNESRVGEQTPETVADLLRGPEGSWLSTTLVDALGTKRVITLQRRRVEVPSIENVHMADSLNGVGYLRLTAFQKTTVADLDQALAKLYGQGLKTLIMDLRGNPGGLLQASVDVADRFIDEGKIVSTHGRYSKENFDYQAHRTGTWRLPLVVLIDRDSASASEIFAGAIRDHNRGILLGETSYGKGSVQGIFRMESLTAGLCLTTAKFYSPSGREINRQGVTPNEEVAPRPAPDSNSSVVALRPNLEGAKSDPVFERAVEIGREQSLRISQRR